MCALDKLLTGTCRHAVIVLLHMMCYHVHSDIASCALQTGLIIRHEDKWMNKGFKVPTFMKGATGVMSSLTFKLFGWGKEVDKATAASPQAAKM